ncbi:benzaldehyde dehydrogenase (NAD+) [Brevibacterium sanguinis]|uniref:Benzaldehyde dehydrogenase (NAD+) n=2 Tax=Brevibacterium TaxID=1696 RepID=A0A366IGK0_9MICO|nr:MULTISPECIES: aldehyde dehydrogenase family protein [Brevibacterium]RBP62768.1 benzaldehyde dehydrogenase (NAD+) [Brevibacterium sanguinis]RBP69333.1 benzaldehyde dehydrogenase (NAD+) [Brevibacterium celere]
MSTSSFLGTDWHGRIFTGSWTAGAAATYDVVEPATGRTLATLGAADAEDVRDAATRAAAAQREWARTAPADRAAVLRKAGALWAEHAEEIADWIVREAGSIRPKAALELAMAEQICFESSALPSHPQGQVLTSNEPRWSFSRRVPAGVVSVIAPFNFPLILSIRSVAPALALGNAVLLKPDPRTAVCGGVTLARIFAEAGLPEGLLQVLPGGLEVGEAVVSAPEVSVISFTGSTAAGRKVGEAAGRLLKRVHLELGGNNALVVLPGADVEAAASAGAFGSWMHQGQICMTTGRHLVHDSIHDEYVSALAERARRLPVGNPATDDVALGPIIDEAQRTRVRDIIDKAQADGARLAAGGAGEGAFVPPTVLTDLSPSNPAWTQEIFGPVAPVTRFSTLAEAAETVNASEYGLSLGILGDVGMALELADLVDTGKVHINEQTVSDEANVPFGGMKDSGNGSRFGGAEANIEAFTETQWITMRSQIAPYPF